MLGHVVLRFFQRRAFVTSTINARYEREGHAFWAEVQASEPNVVVNCIGLIKQKSSSLKDLLSLNAAFPLVLRLRLPSEALLVQPSTDCVFAGTEGMYQPGALPNATDDYGLSKALGEYVLHYPNTLVIRTSIIGPELSGSWGLLSWFLSHSDGSQIDGYLHHRWNGITTLEWCNVLAGALDSRERKPTSLIQAGTERVYSKAEILRLLASTFKRNIRIADVATGPTVDRSLKPNWPCKPLELQLTELHNWMAEV
jgi:dTDP-4-dehydrorhamnose reductase